MSKTTLTICIMALIAAMAAGCITDRHDDGSSETSLFGFIPISATDSEGNTHMFSVIPAGPTDWLGMGLKILAGVTAGSTALSAASKNGRRQLETVADPEAGTLKSIQALGNVATFGLVPPPKEV